MSTLKALLASLSHPAEISAMFKLKFGTKMPAVMYRQLSDETLTAWEFCYAALNKVSRSFAMVIQQLPDEIKDAICVFYLVLRGLDTVEDDMAIPNDVKLPMLRVFHEHLTDKKWCMDGVGYKDERTLLQKFHKVIELHQALKPAYQEVISDICHRMALGMCDFAERKVKTIADYNLYCHYVAGLVGIGLSKIFSCSGLEAPEVAKSEALANSMGLFLQKTNIIRDYLEDAVDGRSFWPPEIWSNYATELTDLKEDAMRPTKGLTCLNHMVADAMAHVPDVISYMSMIKDPQVFAFCALPQVMAIGTLSELYNNDKVFKGVVKIRKGLSARLMFEVKDMRAMKIWFRKFGQSMRARLRADDAANTKRIAASLDYLDDATADVAELVRPIPQWCAFRLASALCTLCFAVSTYALFMQRRDPAAFASYSSMLSLSEHSLLRLVTMLFIGSVIYLLAFVGIHAVPASRKKAAPLAATGAATGAGVGAVAAVQENVSQKAAAKKLK